ncbi:MAG: amidase, partial [Chloroflexota bacterium]
MASPGCSAIVDYLSVKGEEPVNALSAFSSASETARAIRQCEVSAVEVLDDLLGRISRYNPALNAIVTLDEAGARQQADQADQALLDGKIWGPLHGLPVTVKDVFEVAGVRSTCSYAPLANHVPLQDAAAVQRLRRAGAI